MSAQSLRSKFSPYRAVGLSNRQNVKPLLTIPGRENKIAQKVVNKQLERLAMAELHDSDPPQSSDSDEAPSRADIRPATFKTSDKSKPPSSPPTRPKRQAAQAQTRATRVSKHGTGSKGSEPSSSAEGNLGRLSQESSQSRKRKSPDSIKPASRPVSAGIIFPGEPKVRTAKPTTYSRRKQQPEEIDDSEVDTSPQKEFRKPKDLLAKKQSESPQAKFLQPASKKKFPFRGSPDKKRIKSSFLWEKLKIESPEDERPKFIIPDVYSSSFNLKEEDDDKFETTGMSAIDRLSESPSPLPISSKALCSMCDQEVDEKVREKFDAKHPGSRFNLRREQQFCQFHKRNSARKTWKAKGYPDINWNKLDKRIADRHKFLQAILEGGQSYYGDIFKNSVKSGQNRTLLKSETNMTPGYYGIRGLRVMTDNLTYKFSGLLRERAVQDRLISARGHTAYLQTVLVPELAVQLIKEDMSVTEEKARTIMEESTTVGELLNEEVKDVVLESEDEKDKTDDQSEDDSDFPEL
ncbi:RTC4-like domain-containing protein [Rhypophila decipiens]|uniref:Restriction of telomere capping protein 4 n=1 Tax=Rhypophila decipiens TaxID=261697 RepID=A0AAN6YP71_9PEZI|nr:RTC4-like domain-containing protein [Rhypophila decipiens]